MPVGETVSSAIANAYFQGTGITAVSDIYPALITITGLSTSVSGWAASTAVTSGTTTIVEDIGGVYCIFKASGTFTGGTTGTSNPFTSQTCFSEGMTVTDNGGTWTEQSIVIRGGTFVEASGGNYARQTYASTSTNFTLSVDSNNREKVVNAVVFYFTPSGAAATAAFGWGAGVAYMSASTAGNILFWIIFSNPTYITSGSTPQLPASGDSIAVG